MCLHGSRSPLCVRTGRAVTRGSYMGPSYSDPPCKVGLAFGGPHVPATQIQGKVRGAKSENLCRWDCNRGRRRHDTSLLFVGGWIDLSGIGGTEKPSSSPGNQTHDGLIDQGRDLGSACNGGRGECF